MTETLPSLWLQTEMHGHSGAPAIISPRDASLTFAEAWSFADRLTLRLRKAAVREGSAVAIVMPDGPEMLATILALCRRFACAPINPALTSEELTAYLRELAPDALIVTPESPAAAKVGAALGLTVLEAQPGGREWKSLAERTQNVVRAEIRPDVALLLQTSATTGPSKLVGLSQTNLTASAASTASALSLAATDRVLLLAPLFHLQGALSAMLQLAVGGSVIVTSGFDGEQFAHWLTDLRPTWYTCGPTMHRAICTRLEADPPISHSLRFVRSIGAPMPAELARRITRVLGVPLLNGYGMTETGVVTSVPGECALARVDSVGRSTGAEIRVIRPDGSAAATNEAGEIELRGASVIRRYLSDSDTARNSFHDGWLRTGDLGRLDADGFLYLTGRLKEQINRGGEKINPEEVDQAFALHPAVREAAAFAVPHPALGQDVACAIVLHPATKVSVTELRRFAAERLAPFKLPRRIWFVDSIPRGATGKARRFLLAEQFLQAAAAVSTRTKEQIEPTRLEDELLDIWKGILQRKDLTHDEDFFSAGGDSILVVEMLLQVEQYISANVTLPMETFVEDPTVSHLAAMILGLTTPGGAESVTGDIIVLPMQKGSPVDPGQPVPPPIFYIPPDRGHGFGLVHLARALGPQWSVSVVRPANMRHPSTVTAIEESAARCVAAIRAEQPTGPYLLTGGCYGGIVAFEAARLLEAQGEHLALILMDVPIPGYPQAIGHPRHASAHWRLLRATLRDLSKKGRKRHYLRIASRKVLWNIGLRTRPLMARFAHRRTIRRLIDEAMTNDLPFYRLRQTSIPILHLLATERPDVVARESYLGWDRLAIGGLTCHTFSGNHLNWFGGGNSPLILKAIRKWIETQSFLFR